MKLHHRSSLGAPSRSPRAGNALAVVLFLLGVALGWAGHVVYVSGGLLQGQEVASIGAPGAEIGAAEPEGFRGASREPIQGASAAQRDRQESSSALEEPPTEAERLAQNEERVRRLRLLTSGEPEERLALAREILREDGIGPLTMRALGVLAELDPKSGARELKRRIQQAGGETSGLGMAASLISRLGGTDDILTTDDLSMFYDAGTIDVQVAAAKVLAGRGDDSLVQRFMHDCSTSLESEEASVRLDSVRKLAMFRTPESTELLAECLDDDSEEVRLQAVLSIGFGTRDPSIIDALRSLESDPSERIRSAVERQLTMLERMPATPGR